MKQDIQWFKERELSTVIRIDTDGNKVEKEILNEKDAEYFYNQQSDGYTFKAKVRIHRQPPESCESCSA
jgi:hypothetical protein